MKPKLSTTILCLILWLTFAYNSLYAQKDLSKPPNGNNSFHPLKIWGDDLHLEEFRKNKGFREKEDRMNQKIRLFGSSASDTNIITIPVVVHIINPNRSSSISDSAIIDGIKSLNDAFSKSGAYDTSHGVDTKIRFCLAKTDPDGGITNGITRTTSYFGRDLNYYTENAKIMNLIQWDPYHYANIWLVKNIFGENFPSFSCGKWKNLGIGGYSSLPPSAGQSNDGIVITSFGVVSAHEMGHYLGLYHTFQDSCINFDCTTDGDQVCDTPPEYFTGVSPSCSNPKNTCHSDTLSNYSDSFFLKDVPDQIDNFMDYNGACANRFTQGQTTRMRAAIRTERSMLLKNECDAPCSENIVARFTLDTAYTAVGDSVTFTNTSKGAIHFSWLVNDVPISASDTTFKYIFTASGKYKISLHAYNNDATCFGAFTSYVIVNCGVTARFDADKMTIASSAPLYPDSVRFTNISFRGVTFKWLMINPTTMTENIVSTAPNFTYTFPAPSTYSVRLVATNGACSDTTNYLTITVLDPTPDVLINTASSISSCDSSTKITLNVCVQDSGYGAIPKNTFISFYDADPRYPGANKLLPSFKITDSVLGNCTTCFTHTINVPNSKTDKIYIVGNDLGTSNPLKLPNSSLVEKNYENNMDSIFLSPYVITIDTVICESKSFILNGKKQTKTGTYIDTTNANFHLGCDSIIITNLTVNPSPKPRLGANIALCEHDSLVLNPGKFESYLWQNGSTNPTLSITAPGQYYVTVKNNFNCSGGDTAKVSLYPLPQKFLPMDTSLCEGNIIPITLVGYKAYQWNTGDNTGSINISKTGQYILNVTDSNNCKGTDSFNVIFITNCILFAVPNAYTPYSNGYTVFKPTIPAPVTNYSFQVFNRYGNKLFETHNQDNGWNGSYNGVPQNSGTYIYMVSLTDYMGNPFTKNGTFVLIR